MKINFLDIAGFRGVKDRLHLKFSQGFVVISGRNGSGKSTICDAIEYVLIGKIRPIYTQPEKGETFSDYLWWRGKGSAKEKYVSLGLIDDKGQEFMISRSESGKLTVSGNHNIENLLCNLETSPPNCIKELCKTTIIRDEEITESSINLSETERFQFIRAALGLSDFPIIEKKANEVLDYLKDRYSELEKRYSIMRDRVYDGKRKISQMRVEATKSADTKISTGDIKEVLDVDISDETDLYKQAVDIIPTLRVQIDNLFRISNELEINQKQLNEIKTDKYKKYIIRVERQVQISKASLIESEKKLEKLDRDIRHHQSMQPELTSLAELHEHGSRLGLVDQNCPLCGLEISKEDYNAHLGQIKDWVSSASKTFGKLIQNRADTINELNELKHKIETSKSELRNLTGAEVILGEKLESLKTQAITMGCKIGNGETLGTKNLSTQIEINKKKIDILEPAIAKIEYFKVGDRILIAEKEESNIQEKVDKIEKEMHHIANMRHEAKEALDLIHRVRGEITDEKLAELSPIFQELYTRLRPHIDWQNIRYHLRGDVRHFLSLDVGDSLNPRYLFSSGQNRAAGLAFLLAVYLSRNWCHLKTLILDDPIQHIDDYRGLHLVEVLSAIRLSGHQIICTVEDPALARLLNRRLKSVIDFEGSEIRMAYNSDRGVYSESINEIQPSKEFALIKEDYT